MACVTKIIGKIQTSLTKRAIVQREKNINKYLGCYNINKKAADEIYYAREGIANFAKKHGVKVDIFRENVGHSMEEIFDGAPAADTLTVKVTNRKKKYLQTSLPISSDTENIYPKTADNLNNLISGKYLLDSKKNIYVEDTFLRNLYRTITELTKIVIR